MSQQEREQWELSNSIVRSRQPAEPPFTGLGIVILIIGGVGILWLIKHLWAIL